MATPFIWTSASRSDVGLVRALNEDACLDAPERGMWAVADGMGGHAAGDVASRMIVDALAALPIQTSLARFVADARHALDAVNRRLREEAAKRRVGTIGSTIAICLASENRCALLWAGDSRIYLYRDASLSRLTRDHSQVEELRSRGYLTEDEARHHPAQHLITRAVGAASLLELDETYLEVRDRDTLLLCTDGLTNEVPDAEIADTLARGSCEAAVLALVDRALQRGGRDNISAIVVRADDPAADKTLINPSMAAP